MFSLSEGISVARQALSSANEISNQFAHIDTSDRFNPNTSNDNIAQNINWGSIDLDTSGQDLIERSDSLIEYKQSNMMRLFSFMFMAVGIVMILMPIYELILNQSKNYEPMLFIIGAIFILAGYLIQYSSSKEISFNKNSGLFTKGIKSKIKFIEEPYEEHKLEDIYAIQIVHNDIEEKKERNNNDNDFFDSTISIVRYYQLNIILKSTKRINISSSPKYHSIMTEARIISRFIDKPIWNFADMNIGQARYGYN
jgi:hypothetical protein